MLLYVVIVADIEFRPRNVQIMLGLERWNVALESYWKTLYQNMKRKKMLKYRKNWEKMTRTPEKLTVV